MLALAVFALTSLTACTSSVPTGTPGVDRVGKYLLRHTGPEATVVISYRFATNNLGEPWLILDMAASGEKRTTTEIKREGVFVMTPKGDKIALPTQREFAQAYPELQSMIRRASVASEPLDYFGADRARCLIEFFAIPGTRTTNDVLYVNNRRACSGRLYFPVPGGVEAGGWIFGIDLEESRIRIPFILEPEL
jgi:hypothetical protein